MPIRGQPTWRCPSGILGQRATVAAGIHSTAPAKSSRVGYNGMMARRRSRYDAPRRRAGSVLIDSGVSRSRRGRRSGPGGWARVLALLAVAAAGVGGVVVWRSHTGASHDQHVAARRFAEAWGQRDAPAMWRALPPRSRAAHPVSAFAASYRQADRAVGVRSVRIAGVASEGGGGVAVTAIVRTRDFGALRGQVRLPVSGSGDTAGVDWDPSLR